LLVHRKLGKCVVCPHVRTYWGSQELRII